MSLKKVAALAEIDPGHLSKVERGEKLLSLDSMHRLAVVLGLTEFAQMLALYLPERPARRSAGDEGPASEAEPQLKGAA